MGYFLKILCFLPYLSVPDIRKLKKYFLSKTSKNKCIFKLNSQLIEQEIGHLFMFVF